MRVHRLREGRGQVLVELALVLPVLLLVVVALLQFGKAFKYWIDMTHLSSEGARWAIVNKDFGRRRRSRTTSGRRGTRASSVRACACASRFPVDSTPTPGEQVKVRLEYDFRFLSWFADGIGLPAPTIEIETATTQRLEQIPTNYSTSDNHPAARMSM